MHFESNIKSQMNYQQQCSTLFILKNVYSCPKTIFKLIDLNECKIFEFFFHYRNFILCDLRSDILNCFNISTDYYSSDCKKTQLDNKTILIDVLNPWKVCNASFFSKQKPIKLIMVWLYLVWFLPALPCAQRTQICASILYHQCISIVLA